MSCTAGSRPDADVLIAVVAGVVLGVASKAVNAVAPAWTGNSLALWLLVAFLVGLGARTGQEGALRGAAVLVVANCAYYAWRLFVTDDIGLRFALRAFTFWTALAIPAGAASGALAQRGREGLALAAGGFAGEAAFTAANGGHAAHVAVAGVAAAVLALRTSWTRPGAWIAAAAFVAVAGAAVLRRIVLA